MPHEKPAFGQILLVILPEVPLTGPSLSNALLHRPYGGQIPRADKYRTVNIMLQQMLREVTPAACLPDNHLHQTVQRAGVIPGQANAEIRFQFQQACKSRTYEIRQVILSEADKHIAAVHLRLHLHPPVLGGRADGHQMERVDTPDHSRHPVHRDRRDLHQLHAHSDRTEKPAPDRGRHVQLGPARRRLHCGDMLRNGVPQPDKSRRSRTDFHRRVPRHRQQKPTGPGES